MIHKIIWKVTVIGIKNSGKSSLISSAAFKTGTPLSTRGFIRKKVNIEIDGEDYDIDLLFFEMPLENISDKMLSKSTFILLTTDITNMRSLIEAENFIKNNSNNEIFIIAMKSDIRYKSEFWSPELDKIKKKYNVMYYLYNTEEDFCPLLNDILKNSLGKIYNQNK